MSYSRNKNYSTKTVFENTQYLLFYNQNINLIPIDSQLNVIF